MKYNININQKGLDSDKEITLIDASVIDWIHTFCGSNSKKINAQKIDGFTWVNCNHLINDMPLLRIKTRSGASKLLTRLEVMGYIEIRREPRKILVKPTEKIDDLYLENVSYGKQTVSPGIPKCIPQDTNHNTNNIIQDHTLSEPRAQEEKPKGKRQIAREKKELEYNFSEYMASFSSSAFKPEKILHFYFLHKNYYFANLSQWESEVAQSKKAAISLQGYSSDEISRTFDWLDSKFDSWSLYAVVRNIANFANKK